MIKKMKIPMLFALFTSFAFVVGCSKTQTLPTSDVTELDFSTTMISGWFVGDDITVVGTISKSFTYSDPDDWNNITHLYDRDPSTPGGVSIVSITTDNENLLGQQFHVSYYNGSQLIFEDKTQYTFIKEVPSVGEKITLVLDKTEILNAIEETQIITPKLFFTGKDGKPYTSNLPLFTLSV